MTCLGILVEAKNTQNPHDKTLTKLRFQMEGCPHRCLGTGEEVPQDDSVTMDIGITDGLFHASCNTERCKFKLKHILSIVIPLHIGLVKAQLELVARSILKLIIV